MSKKNNSDKSPDLTIKQTKFKSFIRPFDKLTSPRKSSSIFDPLQSPEKPLAEKSYTFKEVLKTESVVKVGTTIKIENDEDLHLFIALTKRPNHRAVSKTEKKIKRRVSVREIDQRKRFSSIKKTISAEIDEEEPITPVAPYEIKESLEDTFDDDFKFKLAIKDVKFVQETQKKELESKIEMLKNEMNSLIHLEIQKLKENHENELLKLKNRIELTNKIFEEKTVKTTEELNQFKLKKLEEEKFNLKVDFDELKKNYEKIELEMMEKEQKIQQLVQQKQQEIDNLSMTKEKEMKDLIIQNEITLKKQESKLELKRQQDIEILKKDFEIHLKNHEKKLEQEFQNTKEHISEEKEVPSKKHENESIVKKKAQEFEKKSIPENLASVFVQIKENKIDHLELTEMNLTDEEVEMIFFELMENTSIVSIDFSSNKRIKGNFLTQLENYLFKTTILEELTFDNCPISIENLKQMVRILLRNKSLNQFTGGTNETTEIIDTIESIMDRNYYKDVY
eukprot:gene12055-5551_t